VAELEHLVGNEGNPPTFFERHRNQIMVASIAIASVIAGYIVYTYFDNVADFFIRHTATTPSDSNSNAARTTRSLLRLWAAWSTMTPEKKNVIHGSFSTWNNPPPPPSPEA